jgi:hypothetical protein
MTTVELPTFDALYQIARGEIQARNPNLTDFEPGSNLDAVSGASAGLADEVIRIAVLLFAELFVDTASEAGVEALALDRFDLTRNPATPARGEWTWSEGIPGSAYTIPAGTQLQVVSNGIARTVITRSAVSLQAGQSSIPIPVETSQEGRDQNLPAGLDVTVIDTIPADPTATVTATDRLAGGSDIEPIEVFKDRIRAFFGTVVRGTVEALRFGARTVPGVSGVAVIEDLPDPPVTVVVGDPDGNSNSTLADLVAVELDNWRAAGIQVVVEGAIRQEVPIALDVLVVQGATAGTVSEAIKDSIAAYGDTLQPNQTAQLSQITLATHQASDLVIGARVTSTTTNILPDTLASAIRFPQTGITLTITEASI